MSETKNDFDYSSIDSDLGWTERGNPDINADDGNEPDPINHLREFAIERIDDVMKPAIREVFLHKRRDFARACMNEALGWFEENGKLKGSQQIAEYFNDSKQNTNKLVARFYAILGEGIKPLETGQRSAESKRKFAQKAKEYHNGK